MFPEIVMYRKAVLLLLFCCAAGTVSISLSQEQASPSDPETVKANSVVVSIPTDDEFYFGKNRVMEADIPEKIKQALKDKPQDEQIVYVKAAVFVRYGTVVSVIDAIRQAGFDRIGLVADKKNPNVKPTIPAKNPSGSRDITLSAAWAVILIDIKSKTQLKLNSKPMLLSRLRSRLQKLLDGRSDKTVFIRGPRKMAYGDVMKVIDIAKSAGAQPIGLQTDQLD
jgi:biopolymer transport protein ExbD